MAAKIAATLSIALGAVFLVAALSLFGFYLADYFTREVYSQTSAVWVRTGLVFVLTVIGTALLWFGKFMLQPNVQAEGTNG
jgi:heme/copper-type cytochrome/quinol oxidase subunit 3